jgi:hypothetical protein
MVESVVLMVPVAAEVTEFAAPLEPESLTVSHATNAALRSTIAIARIRSLAFRTNPIYCLPFKPRSIAII